MRALTRIPINFRFSDFPPDDADLGDIRFYFSFPLADQIA